MSTEAIRPAPPEPASISVAMCTYNGARFLGEQLQSILGQTRQVSEIVISDDGSVDGTLELVQQVIDRAAVTHPGLRFAVLRNAEPLGVTANFEQAVRACTGDVISLSDQDDRWMPERVERLVALLEDSGAELVFSDAELIDGAGSALKDRLFASLEVRADELDDVRAGRGFEVLVRRNIATGATVLFRRSLLERAVPFPPPWVHDEWLAAIAAGTGAIAVADEALIEYRQHGANQIGVRRPTLRYKIGRVLEARGDRLDGIVARAQSLLARLEQLDADEAYLRIMRDKLRVERMRATLPRSRWRRLGPVLKAGADGSYSLTSQGRLDMVRDLVQPHGPRKVAR